MSTERGPASGLDEGALREYMNTAGLDADIIGAMGQSFLAEAPERIAALRNAISSGRADEVRVAAHALKSPAAALKATRLAELLQELEERAADGEPGGSEDLERIRGELDAVKADLEDLDLDA